jgi:hypothetical protein
MNVESKRIKHSFVIIYKSHIWSLEMNMENRQYENRVENSDTAVADTDADTYISQMSPFEMSAYRIAKSHLGTSFNLKKSNGFLKWISKK